MAIEDLEGDIFRTGNGIYFSYGHYKEMEKDNPNGLGDYPRRMIVQEESNEKECRNGNGYARTISNRR